MSHNYSIIRVCSYLINVMFLLLVKWFAHFAGVMFIHCRHKYTTALHWLQYCAIINRTVFCLNKYTPQGKSVQTKVVYSHENCTHFVLHTNFSARNLFKYSCMFLLSFVYITGYILAINGPNNFYCRHEIANLMMKNPQSNFGDM